MLSPKVSPDKQNWAARLAVFTCAAPAHPVLHLLKVPGGATAVRFTLVLPSCTVGIIRSASSYALTTKVRTNFIRISLFSSLSSPNYNEMQLLLIKTDVEHWLRH